MSQVEEPRDDHFIIYPIFMFGFLIIAGWLIMSHESDQPLTVRKELLKIDQFTCDEVKQYITLQYPTSSREIQTWVKKPLNEKYREVCLGETLGEIRGEYTNKITYGSGHMR